MEMVHDHVELWGDEHRSIAEVRDVAALAPKRNLMVPVRTLLRQAGELTARWILFDRHT